MADSTAPDPDPAPSHVRAALDVAPLHGHRTGVGLATECLLDEFRQRDDVAAVPYLVSFRARRRAGESRLPLPAGIAMRAWARTDRPRVDRWLGGVDVVHGTNYVAPPTRLPTVISVYDCWFLANPDAITPSVARSGAVLRRAVARGARIHVSSAATAAAAADLLDTDRISVVHLGLPPLRTPTPTPAPGSPASDLPEALRDRPVLVAIGTVERRKDLPSLVDAFARIAPTRPDLRLAIVGAPGDDHHRVLTHIERASTGVRDRIHLLGAVETAVRDAVLAHSLALVYPSLDEGFGFPILEAQQAGTPVVARPAGSIPEVGGDGVHLADDSSVDALASAIASVVDDAARREALSAAGRRNLSRFSWAATARSMLELYRLAIDEHDPPPFTRSETR